MSLHEAAVKLRVIQSYSGCHRAPSTNPGHPNLFLLRVFSQLPMYANDRLPYWLITYHNSSVGQGLQDQPLKFSVSSELTWQPTFIPTPVNYYRKKDTKQNQQRKRRWGEVWRKTRHMHPMDPLQGETPWTHFILPAMHCDNFSCKSCLLGKFIETHRNSVIFTGGCSHRQPPLGTYQDSRFPEGKQVFQDQLLCLHSSGTVSCC